VALNRIAVFLDEEEVTDQVSSLKKDNTGPHLPGADHEGLGLENATLRWNSVAETESETKANAADQSISAIDVDETSRTEDLTNTSISSSEDRMFELLDVSVKFPEGQLTVVTGPTASGKTALLVMSSFHHCIFH
jgi:ABC-type transport system involved in cytochrome bd biosynthesis fused ATPase/permease subunit